MIYTTLKANREAGIDFVNYIDDCMTAVGRFFGEKYGEEYVDENGYTEWDQLWRDFSEKQIESTVLKAVKEDAKNREDGYFFKYDKFLIDREFAYNDIEQMVQKGLLKASDLREIDRKSKKFNFKIFKEDWGEDGYFHTYRINDLIDEYFPCNVDNGGECTNCCNCD